MDMNRFLQHRLTNTVLEGLPGRRYEGRVSAVVPERVFNRFKLTSQETVPQITFEDGWLWIPNIGARRGLTAAWGADTDEWIGRRMAVYLCIVARTDKPTGRQVERWEKRVEVLPD